jgi:N-acyl homoserine lactone hydrolase
VRRLAYAAAAVSAAALLACGGTEVLTSPKAKDIQPPPRDLPALPRSFEMTARRVEHVKLRIYNTGQVKTRGSFVSSIKSFASKVTLDVPAFLIKHPKKGLVLFDTGLSPLMETDPGKAMGRFNHFFVPFEAKNGQTLLAQLKRDGLDPADVRYVVISHAHLDHTGLIDGFPNAEVVVDRREWEAQRAKQSKKFDEHEIDPVQLERKLKLRLIDFSAAPQYGSFDHGVDLLGDGTVVLLELTGHTAGNMGAWINLDSGPVVLTGDASWILDNHQDLALPIKGHIFDLDRYWRRLYELRAAQEALPQLVIYPGHDLLPLKLQPRDDVSLAPF